jgi:multisubunit Na+/H+ antiporter MnhF subunit
MMFIILACLLIAVLTAVAYMVITNSNLVRLLTLCYATNVMLTFICVYGVISGNKSYIDIALIYALISPAATIAILRFLRSEK